MPNEPFLGPPCPVEDVPYTCTRKLPELVAPTPPAPVGEYRPGLMMSPAFLAGVIVGLTSLLCGVPLILLGLHALGVLP